MTPTIGMGARLSSALLRITEDHGGPGDARPCVIGCVITINPDGCGCICRGESRGLTKLPKCALMNSLEPGR